MGNRQSSPTDIPASSAPREEVDKNVETTNNHDNTTLQLHLPTTRPKKKLEGMALIQYKCRKSKAKYETCVSDWYGKEFMKGDYANQEEACGELFETYKKCVLKGVRKEFWGKNDKPKEGSFLSELEDDE